MASVSSAGARIQPMRQPVTLNVFDAPLMVTVRSRMPGQRGQRHVLALEPDVLVDLVGDRQDVVLDAEIADRLELGSG